MSTTSITAEQAREALPSLKYATDLASKIAFFTSSHMLEEKSQLAFAVEKAAAALGFKLVKE